MMYMGPKVGEGNVEETDEKLGQKQEMQNVPAAQPPSIGSHCTVSSNRYETFKHSKQVSNRSHPNYTPPTVSMDLTTVYSGSYVSPKSAPPNISQARRRSAMESDLVFGDEARIPATSVSRLDYCGVQGENTRRAAIQPSNYNLLNQLQGASTEQSTHQMDFQGHTNPPRPTQNFYQATTAPYAQVFGPMMEGTSSYRAHYLGKSLAVGDRAVPFPKPDPARTCLTRPPTTPSNH